MADLVNPTHKSALSTRNQEPSHLNTGDYEVLGGPGVSSEPGGADYKIDAGRGVSTDTTIPKSVAAEPSHLKTEEDEADVEVDFGDELTETDDLDKELDQFENVDEIGVDVDVDDNEEDDDEEDVTEESDDDKEAVTEEDDNDELPLDDEDDDKEDVTEESDDDKEAVTEEDEQDKLDEEDDDELKENIRVRIKLPKIKLTESVVPRKNQKRVATLIEQAVRSTTKQVAQQLHEKYRKIHEAKIARRDAVLAKQIDSYLSYVVEEWVKQNRVQIRQSLRVQLAEEFLNGLQQLFKEHYIDVPESKVDVVKKLTEQNNKLRKALNEASARQIKLRKLAEAANKARHIAEFARTLTESQAQRLRKLAEDVPYLNAKDFRERLTALKESYFPTKGRKLRRLPEEDTEVLAEQTKHLDEQQKTNKVTDPVVAEIADALSRTAKRDW